MEIKKVLVPAVGHAHSRMMAAFAMDIAKRRNASVTAMYVVEVPSGLPIDAALPEDAEEGERVVEGVRAMGERLEVAVATRIVNARSAADAIIDEAEAGGYDLIVLGVSRKRVLAQLLYGDVVSEVMKRAPCMVCVGRVGKGSSHEEGEA